MTEYIFVLDGIGAFDGATSEVMRSVADELQGSLAEHGRHFKVEWIPWPASLNPIGPISWKASTDEGVQQIERRVGELQPGDKFVLLAFSGGNRPVHEWLEQTAVRDPARLDDVLAVGLVSDPYRPRGKQQAGMPVPGGWGLSGEKEGPIPDRTFWLAYLRDVITDARWDALLRTAADVIDYFPGDLLRGLAKLIENKNPGDFQLAVKLKLFHENPLNWFIGLGPRLGQARDDIVGYATGLHTRVYVQPFAGGPPPTVRLARTISWKVRNP